MYIYKITNNNNNKIYVGKSSKMIEESESYFGSGIVLNNAKKKYGLDNFTKEILEEVTAETINEKERYWIKKLDSTNPLIGYNLASGGDGGDLSDFIDYTNPEYKRKLSESQMGEKNSQFGKKYTEEEKLKNPAFFYKNMKGKDNPNYGKKATLETRQRQSKASTGAKNSQFGKVWCVQKNAKDKSNIKSFFKKDIPIGWITCAEFDNMKRNDPNKRHWYNDGVKNYLKYPSESDGLVKGRIKKSSL